MKMENKGKIRNLEILQRGRLQVPKSFEFVSVNVQVEKLGLDSNFGHFENRLQCTAFFQTAPIQCCGVLAQSERMRYSQANGRN